MTTTSHETPPGWSTITDLARQLGVDKSAVSRRVARFESLGLLSTRTQGKAKLVEVAAFNQAAASTVDAVRALNGKGATGPPPSLVGAPGDNDPVLAYEQARRAKYDAEMKQLDLEERRGRLVEVEAVCVTAEAGGRELARVIDQLPGCAEALAAVLMKEGVAGFRVALRATAREWRAALARVAKSVAAGEDLDAEADVEAEGQEAAA